MIHRVVQAALRQKFLVLMLTAAAILMVRRTAVDPPLAHRRAPPRLLLQALDALIVIAAALAYAATVSERFELLLPGKHLSLSSAANPTTYCILLVIIRLVLALPVAIARFPGESLGDRLRSSRFPPALWIAFLLITTGTLGSLGLNAFLHTFLFEHVSAFRSIRAVARWAMLAYVGLSLAAAYGVTAFLRRLSTRSGPLVAVALVLLALNDVRTNIIWDHAIPAVPAVTQWIRQTSIPGPLIELPMDAGSAQYYYLLWHTAHHKLVMNGTSGFEPPVYQRLHDLSNANVISDEFTDILVRNHCALVVMHNDFLAEQTPKYIDWLRRELARGRLAFVRRFDHSAEGDWVFAVTPAMREWQRFRAPETRDVAGFTPSQNLQRMLAGEATFFIDGGYTAR